MSYSMDFIKAVVSYKQSGHTFNQLKEVFGIPSITYYDWVKKLAIGHFEVKVKRERNRKIDKEVLKKAITDKPDAFLKELAELFGCTESAVFYALKNLKITRKKRLLRIRKNLKRSGRSISRN